MLQKELRIDGKDAALIQNAKQRLCLHISHLRANDIANVIYSMYSKTKNFEFLVYYYAFAMEGVTGQQILDGIQNNRATKKDFKDVKKKKMKSKSKQFNIVTTLTKFLLDGVFRTMHGGSKHPEQVEATVREIAKFLCKYIVKYNGYIPRVLFQQNVNPNSRSFIADGNCTMKETKVASKPASTRVKEENPSAMIHQI